MSRILPTAVLLTVFSLACTSADSPNSSPAAPASIQPPSPAAATLLGPLASAGGNLVEGALGLAELSVDPVAMTGEILPFRELQTQGDLYELSIRPFFQADDLRVESVRRGAAPDTVIVAVRFQHPFDAPIDLLPPATASKRIDLHVFGVTALLAVDGTDAFFSNGVITNASLLRNADGYRDPGLTFNRSALGVGSATVFPYKLVAPGMDTGNPLGTYDPFNHGWTGPALLAPTGYDIFPQGAAATVEFEIFVGDGPTTFPLLTLAKYMDPRSTPNPKSKRLPVSGDPASLQYILPHAAGDIGRIEASLTGTLQANSSAEIAILDITILDWDHGAPIAASFPNPANLGELPASSDVDTIEVSIPQLRAATPFFAPTVTGTAPLLQTSLGLTNDDLFDPTDDTEVLGLIRVTDMQDLAGTPPVALDETLQPVFALDSTRYQVIRVPVDATGLTIVLDPFPTPGGINSDMGSAALFNLVTNCPKIMAVDGQGDVYCALRRTAGAGLNGWYVYRSTDNGTSWPTPATQITAVATSALPNSLSHSIGILANDLPALAVVGPSSTLGYVAAQGESGASINWGPASNGVIIASGGVWYLPNICASPTDPNRVYVIAKNQSATTGIDPNGISIFFSQNGASASPTFAHLGRVDGSNGPLSAEYDPIAHMDSQGDIHVAWLSTASAVDDAVMYRKWDDNGSPTGGSWGAPEIALTDPGDTAGRLEDLWLAVNALDEPAICVMYDHDNNGLSGDVILLKYNPGPGWTAPQIVNDLTYPNPNSFRKFSQLAFDAANRMHLIWQEDGHLNNADEVWGTVFSPDGLTKLLPDFEIFSANSTTDDFINGPRIEFIPATGKMLVSVYAASTIYTDGRYRYRTYSF